MDIVSYNIGAAANERIEKFIRNPDSNSGIVTVPKVIGAGESVTVPAGRVAVLPNVQVDGTLNIEGEVFVPTGTVIDMCNGLAINGDKVVMSVPTSYHLLQGNLAVDNTVITQGFNTTLYTGNGSTQSINTGIDMDTQWGDTSEEKFGGLVWLKSRSSPNNNYLFDSLRGNSNPISSNGTGSNTDYVTTGRTCTYSNNGFIVGSETSINGSGYSQVSWNFQTTHRVSGTTNHGKPYTCHYNPFTGFTIVKYEGSGIAGHEISHHLGRKLGFCVTKNLNGVYDWVANAADKYLYLNKIDASPVNYVASNEIVHFVDGTGAAINAPANQYIMYGWANSYLNESNKLIGNYEVGVYQGTGVAGNKVKTRGKPAWIMRKRIDGVSDWVIFDSLRNTNGTFIGRLFANTSQVEAIHEDHIDVTSDGFFVNFDSNTSGGQYLYMVAYDTNANGGGSYYPKSTDTANVQINNALIPIAKGSDINGLKNVMLSKNETITGLTYTAGKNYIYCDKNGSYGVKSVAPNYGTTNPANGGDFYNILKNKWYTSAGVEIPEGRNYLNHIVHADNDGGVLYIEELLKIEYKDIIKANEYQGKNACTAWVTFDGTTTPPTIRDSYNTSSIVRTATGVYDVYFSTPMDNTNYTVSTNYTGTGGHNLGPGYTPAKNKITIYLYLSNSVATNASLVSINITGGKN